MTIENLARLTNAVLLNRPSVSSVLDFAFEARKVTRQSAFIAQNASCEEISAAIKNGAYAIISQEHIALEDSEIAYLRVDNLQTALIRLMRFEAASKNLKFCFANAIGGAILGCMQLGKNTSLMVRETSELFLQIMHAKNGDIFFADQVRILQQITPFYETIFTDTKAQIMDGGSIFFTTLISGGVYYQNLALPRVFAGIFSGLLYYLDKNGIEFKIGDLRGLGHFEPIFIDNNFHPTGFGASFRAIIAESDEELFEAESIFLQKKFDQNDIVICLPKNSGIHIQNAVYFNDLSDIKRLKNFRYALVLAQKTDILTALNENTEQPSLF